VCHADGEPVHALCGVIEGARETHQSPAIPVRDVAPTIERLDEFRIEADEHQISLNR